MYSLKGYPSSCRILTSVRRFGFRNVKDNTAFALAFTVGRNTFILVEALGVTGERWIRMYEASVEGDQVKSAV